MYKCFVIVIVFLFLEPIEKTCLAGLSTKRSLVDFCPSCFHLSIN